MLTIEQARRLLSDAAAPLAPIDVDLDAALGLRLAEAQHARFALPPDDVSVMDGYAVRAADLATGPLPVALRIQAGMPRGQLAPGTAARIQTGAVVPAGADLVVPQERVTAGSDGRIRLTEQDSADTLRPGNFIRTRGEVCSSGDTLADAGRELTPRMMGLLAAAGSPRVRATPRPRVAVLTTGSELVGLDEPPGRGRIRDSNAMMLRALAMSANLSVTVHARVPDAREVLLRTIATAAAEHDLVVTSGGVSVGDFDLVRGVVESLRGEILVHGLAIRPGRPTLAARIGSTWLIGLPGNPLSALVGWHLLAGPLAERLSGDAAAFDDRSQLGALDEPASNAGGRTTFAPAVAGSIGDDRGRTDTCRPPAAEPPRLQLVPWKGSHDLYAISRANALAILPPGAKMDAGGMVSFIRL